MKKIIIALLLLLGCVNIGVAQNEYFIRAIDSAKAYVAEHNLKDRRNSYEDKDNVIHIFMFEDGSLLLKGYPTMATEKNKFQLHLFLTDVQYDYIIEYSGNYSPEFNFTGTDRSGPITIRRVDFAILGPFTSTLTLSVKRKKNGESEYKPVTTATEIKISKTIYGSIGSAEIYTSLKNPGGSTPSNIRAIPLPGGDSTLIADEYNGRGMLTIMATFYPSGRNSLMIPGWNFRDRFGIVVGTSIVSSGNNFKDFFLGGQYDFAIGGSFVAGAHYGSRTKIVGVNYKDFTFGQSKFTGNVETYAHWDFGFFIGVQVDSRIFKVLFPNSDK